MRSRLIIDHLGVRSTRRPLAKRRRDWGPREHEDVDPIFDMLHTQSHAVQAHAHEEHPPNPDHVRRIGQSRQAVDGAGCRWNELIVNPAARPLHDHGDDEIRELDDGWTALGVSARAAR